MDAANPPPSDAAAATTVTTATSQLSESEIASLFRLHSDDMLLHDPSRGTCCRNRCSGCAYLNPTSGDFTCDEYTAAGGGTTDAADEDGDPEVAPPLPPCDRELERDRFASLILAAESKVGVKGVSPLALRSLWDVLSPAVGYPRLSSNEITRAIGGMEGSSYEKGGAANFKAFKREMIGAAERIVRPSVGAPRPPRAPSAPPTRWHCPGPGPECPPSGWTSCAGP